MKSIFENVIRRGEYDLNELLERIDKYNIEGKLTDTEREELYDLARQAPKARYNYDDEIERLWAAIRELQSGGGDEPAEDEYPEFVQPTGAHDAYQVGDKVTFNGKHYECMLANCVWSPDVLPSAWQLIE